MSTTRVLTLASTSPRLRQLLEMLGIPVEVRPSNVPEVRDPGELPAAYTLRLARAKAGSVPGAFVLGADTTVALDEHVLEKPADAADAVRILSLLQGRTHEVVTAVALAAGGVTRERVDTTLVTFRPASRAYLEAYVATGEPMDKAGAYGIQGYAAMFVAEMRGEHSGIVGLPLCETTLLLREYGYPI